MKKIGIIGGAGPLASALFYETFVQGCYQKGKAVPEIVLINYPFIRGSKEALLVDELAYCRASLEKQGVEKGVVVCNTLHLYLNRLPKSTFSFHSLPKAVLKEAKIKGHKKLLVLGTQNTCKFGLYQNEEFSLCYLPVRDQKHLDEVIDRVLNGQVLKEDAELVGDLIHKMTLQADFDGVVLGCTDLPVLHHHFPIPSKLPLLDSIKIPVKGLL